MWFDEKLQTSSSSCFSSWLISMSAAWGVAVQSAYTAISVLDCKSGRISRTNCFRVCCSNEVIVTALGLRREYSTPLMISATQRPCGSQPLRKMCHYYNASTYQCSEPGYLLLGGLLKKIKFVNRDDWAPLDQMFSERLNQCLTSFQTMLPLWQKSIRSSRTDARGTYRFIASCAQTDVRAN